MEVILLKSVKNLGNIGDKVEVASGYAWNYLIPSGKALQTIDPRANSLNKQLAAEREKEAEESAALQAILDQVIKDPITVEKKSHDSGALYGRLQAADLLDELNSRADFKFQKSKILEVL